MKGAKNTEVFVGLVINSEKVKESDLRVRLLCQDELKTFTLQGAQKANAKLKSAAQLFTLAEFSAIGHKIIGAHVLTTNHAITKDIKRYYLACAICEVISKCRGAGFMLTIDAFEKLSIGESVRDVYTQYFTALLHELGYGIESTQTINHAYLMHLDIKIPNTKEFLQ